MEGGKIPRGGLIVKPVFNTPSQNAKRTITRALRLNPFKYGKSTRAFKFKEATATQAYLELDAHNGKSCQYRQRRNLDNSELPLPLESNTAYESDKASSTHDLHRTES